MAEHNTQHMPVPNHDSVFDGQTNESVNRWNVKQCVCTHCRVVYQFSSSSQRQANWLKFNWMDGIEFSVNWNLLFSSSSNTGSLTEFQQNSGAHFAWHYCPNHLLFRLSLNKATHWVFACTNNNHFCAIVCLFVRLFVRTYVSNLHQNQYLKCGYLHKSTSIKVD